MTKFHLAGWADSDFPDGPILVLGPDLTLQVQGTCTVII